MKKMQKYYDDVVFIIDEKDSELFDKVKEQSDDIYFMIENLDFFRVDFVIKSPKFYKGNKIVEW